MYFPLILVLLAVSPYLKECKGSQMVFKTTNIECLPDPKYAENSTCIVKAINWNKGVAQMDCDLKIPLRNTSVHMEVFKKGYSNQYHPFLVNTKFNYCDIMKKKNYSPYGIILMKILKPFTNMNHSCPFTGHLMARNLYLDASGFPPFPLGFYLFSITFMENFPHKSSELVGVVKFFAQAMEMVERKRKLKQ